MPQGKIDFLFKAENSLLISKYYKKECEELFVTDEEKNAELSNQKCLISF